MVRIRIDCAGDQSLCEELVAFFKENKLSCSHQEDQEVIVEYGNENSADSIKEMVQKFLEQSSRHKHQLNKVDDGVYVLAVPLNSQQDSGIISCDICGFSTPYQEEFEMHQRIHVGAGV